MSEFKTAILRADAPNIIQNLINEISAIEEKLKEQHDLRFLAEAVPRTIITRGRQAFWTRYLEQAQPELTVDWPWMITHIFRAEDDYDVIDTSTIPYTPSLAQIIVDGVSLSNDVFDVSMLPMRPKQAYRLPTPLYVDEGSKIQLKGASGLTNLRIGLQGYMLERRPTDADKILKPYFYCIKFEPTDTHLVLKIPDWQNLCLVNCWSFNRIKPSDTDDMGYTDYEHGITSPADGDYSGAATINVECYHGQQRHNFLPARESTANWCGTREWPRPMNFLFPELQTDITVEADRVTVKQGVQHKRWFILGGMYEFWTPTRRAETAREAAKSRD